MSEVAYDNEGNIEITNNFNQDLKSNNDLYLFWVSRVDNKSDFDGNKNNWYFHGNKLYDTQTTEIFKIKTDRITKNKYIVEFSGSGIDGLSQDELKIDVYHRWRFYYYKGSYNSDINNISASNLKIAFNINADNYLFNYTKNLIILDFNSIDPIFEFHPVYRYELDTNQSRGVSLPSYQHYHKTEVEPDSLSNNVLDGSVVKSKIKNYINNKKKSYIDYGSNSLPKLMTNKVKIDSNNERFIINPGSESDLMYTTSNGKFVPNSNLFNAFDNSEYSIESSKYDPYPLVTIYGTDSIGSIDEFTIDSCILIYEIENI